MPADGGAQHSGGRGRSLLRFRAGRGDPLLLLHGLGLTWRAWSPVLPGLTAAHEVLAVDLPGFGSAPGLAGVPPTIDVLTDAVVAELDRAELDRVHVAGNSLGGWIALELARRGRAASVAALAPAGLEAPAHRATVIALNELLRAGMVSATATGLTASHAVCTGLLSSLRGRPWRLSAADAAAEVHAFARAPGFHATLQATVGAAVPTGLDEIDVPVRILSGTRDVLIGGPTAPRFAAAIPGAELAALPGCGHVPMADDPELVTSEITHVTLRSTGRRAGRTP